MLMRYKTLQLIQNLGKKSQAGNQLSWFNKPTTTALPFNVACVHLFASSEPMDQLTPNDLDALRTKLVGHSDGATNKQLNVLDWANQIENRDEKLTPECLYAMAKILSDLWEESFEELYFTVPENERKQAFLNRYFGSWKNKPNYGSQEFVNALSTYSHIPEKIIKQEKAQHPKLFDLLKVLTLDPDKTIYPDYDVGKLVFETASGNLMGKGNDIPAIFKEGLQALAERLQGKFSPAAFGVLEKYFSFEGLLGMDTTLFYAIVKNKYGGELPPQTVFGFEYDQITFDVGENKAGKTGVMMDIKKRLTEIYIDDASQAVIKIEPPLLVHSELYIVEDGGLIEAKLENITTVNYSKFVATLSTHILKGTAT